MASARLGSTGRGSREASVFVSPTRPLTIQFSDHGFGISGVPFLDRQPRKGKLRFCDCMLISNLFAESQRFLVRLAGSLQVPLIEQHVCSSRERVGHSTFVVNFLCDGSRLQVTTKGFSQFTPPSLYFGKVSEHECDTVLVNRRVTLSSILTGLESGILPTDPCLHGIAP